MSKAIQLSIKEPCHENWQNMTPNEQGRHCMSCQKTVVDFTAMSDQEVLAFFSKTNSNVCGRFNNFQLDRDIVEHPKKKRFRFAYAWSILVATTLTATSAKAQGNVRVQLKGKVKCEKVEPQPKPVFMGMITRRVVPDKPVSGFVLDELTNEPIVGASVKIKESLTGKATDQLGAFKFDGLGVDSYSYTSLPTRILEISAVGYETQEITVGGKSITNSYKVLLKRKAEELDPVVVIGYETTQMGKVAITGATTVTAVDIKDSIMVKGDTIAINKPGLTEKIKQVLIDLIPAPFKNNSVKVFPNPQRPGSTLNINLQLKETGEYKMELMDASGRVVWVQSIQVTAKEQTATLPTNSTWSTGIYYLRVTGHHIKNVYQSKVLLQ